MLKRRSVKMSQTLAATFTKIFFNGTPLWVDPFIKAVQRLEKLQRREHDSHNQVLDVKASQVLTSEDSEMEVQAGTDGTDRIGNAEEEVGDAWRNGNKEDIRRSSNSYLQTVCVILTTYERTTSDTEITLI